MERCVCVWGGGGEGSPLDLDTIKVAGTISGYQRDGLKLSALACRKHSELFSVLKGLHSIGGVLSS